MQVLQYPFNDKDLRLIERVINQKVGTVIYPTETFYALGCASNSAYSVERIYELKKRDASLPLLVLVNSWEMLKTYADDLSSKQEAFLQKHWPGALTAVLKTKGNLARELNLKGNTLGFRMTSSPIAQQIIEAAGQPIVGTSANLSGSSEVTDCQKAVEIFGEGVDLYIDGGDTGGTLPSTLVDLSESGNPVLIREGVVKLSQL